MTRMRVMIENLSPQVDGGRFAAKRIIDEPVTVEADIFTDGHDKVMAAVRFRKAGDAEWQYRYMRPLINDRWRGEFTPESLGRYEFSVIAWIDHIGTWQRDLARKREAGQDVAVDLLRGAALADELAMRVPEAERAAVIDLSRALADTARSQQLRAELASGEAWLVLSRRYPRPELISSHESALPVDVDRVRARFSSWYELFPRSTGAQEGKHGTFADCEARLPYVALMGFDVLYLPPIHPIGLAKRKGPNNNPDCSPGDVGSPWAIGGIEGGHQAIHPELGTLEDFRRLVKRAGELGLEVALDIAFQCSPDHPYVREHPEWFLKRPDGSIQYAENPPKKYEDIVPFNFECEAWEALWRELLGIVQFWVAQGVRIFRVDNPHTKPFALWEWIIGEVRRTHPDVIFLAEAFTRPKVMYRLAKLGFAQSYNYFPWRNTKRELTEYFTELNTPPVSDFFRANLWPNTPDILPEYLQFGGRPAFMTRVALAATLGASYGIYGPPYELQENEPRDPGSEEYRNSEKYQLRNWDLDRTDSLREFLTRINRIRQENAPLQRDGGLRFHDIDNEALIAYTKSGGELAETVLVVVNLDPHHVQTGWLTLDLAALGLPLDDPFQAHDLLSGARFLWKGERNYILLDPARAPCHIFRIRRRVRTERDFDYFL